MQNEAHLFSRVRSLINRRKIALGAGICLSCGIMLLLIGSRFMDLRQPHLYGPLNDQIAYINAARNIVRNGTLQADTILPSTLWQKTSRDLLYMPGHPMAIALSYKLFGFGAFQSILPSAVSYVLAMLSIYFIGARVYSVSVGIVASIMFALFPPVWFFAYTAMAELTFVGAFTAAVAACLYLPRRAQIWIGTLLLAVPFLFRETAAFIVLPLGFFFWLQESNKQFFQPLLFIALSVIILVAISRADFAAGRPSLMKAIVFGDAHSIYDDAQAQQAVSTSNWRDALRVLPRRTAVNLWITADNPFTLAWAQGGNYFLVSMMVLVALTAILGRDKFAWGLTAFNLISISAVMTLYSMSGYAGVRHLMFTCALNAVVVASLAVKLAGRIHRKWLMCALAGVVLTLFFAVSFVGLSKMSAFFIAGDAIDQEEAAALESVHPDNSRMLVTPYELAVRYRYDHPVSWSFPPYNQPTLELLAKRFDIGTLILDNNHPLLQSSSLVQLGFYKVQDLTVNDVSYVVFKRPAK